MKNRQTDAAWAYHNGTKHSYESIRQNRHYLDWDNQPMPFKIYPRLEPVALPQDLTSPGISALEAISKPTLQRRPQALPTIQSLAEILFLSAAITRRRRYPGGEILFRAAACTGALYHIDLYIVCGDLEGLGAGVYHFGPQDFSLRRLRAGDYRQVLATASGNDSAVAQAPCVILSASTYWRNAWKYQARAYRHCYWDNGTIMANLIAAAAARGMPARIVLGFVDDDVNALLALDARREAALSLVALGRAPTMAPGSAPPLAALELETLPLSKSEVDYPAIRAMHEASSLESPEEVTAWRKGGKGALEGGGMKDEKTAPRLIPLAPRSGADLPNDTLEDVVLRRGSTRKFARDAITFAQLSTLLDHATGDMDADFTASLASLNELYLIVHAVEGLPSGAYVYRRKEQALGLLKEGDFRRQAGYLGLGQEIPADCSVNVYFLADLHDVLERLGNRGYRAAQLEAAIMGGKLYLGAYAQRLGASGLTFFDDDVTEFFSPHAAGKSVMFLIAIGRSSRRPQK